MIPLKRSPLYSSVFALVFTALALLFSVVLQPYMGSGVAAILIFTIWLSTRYHGRTGGLITIAGAVVAIVFYSFDFGFAGEPRLGVSLRVLSFVAMALLVGWLTASRESHRKTLASIFSSIGDAVLTTDPQGRITYMNAVAETMTGWPAADARRKPVSEVMQLRDVKNRERIENPLNRALREQVTVTPQGHSLLTSHSGAEVPVEISAAPVREASGRIRGGILVFRDVSKRMQLDEQVTHAQKMEAVGRLASGIAGDFNNVLTVITGYAELLRGEMPSSNPLRRFVDEIIYAGERAAALTRHLLAFSRAPGAQPRPLDLNRLLASMDPMLRRLLGQNIELVLLPGSGLARVEADPAQIEQMIVNLATNARDAMAQGGKLVIETAEVDLDDAGAKNLGISPGSYVMLAVSDTGVGMDAETRSRLFEPFFTTKDPGQGSGLGLATVYGIVKQSSGQITVYSQPGCGTIFEIYLPRVREEVPETVRRHSPKGSETILLVDDEEGVRKLVGAVLRSNGYEVLEASNAAMALAAHEKNRHKIDLVLTDVVMPQMNGFELGRELATRAPGLKILYMSGFRDNIAGSDGYTAREANKPFLHKPFTPDGLLAKVREVLDTERV